jgi:precorrin-6B methylase 1
MPYLQPLMQRLVELLRGGNADIQEMAISAISAAAAAAGKNFEPYYQVSLLLLHSNTTHTISHNHTFIVCVPS